MVANPSIPFPSGLNTTAFHSGTGRVWVACLYANGIEGVVKFDPGQYNVVCIDNCCIDPGGIGPVWDCIAPTNGIFKGLGYAYTDFYGSFNAACMAIYTCAGGENCTGKSCTAWSTNPLVTVSNIPVKVENNTIPNTPTGLSASPSDGQLTIDWNAVTDPTGGEVFAYYIEIFTTSTLIVVARGYINPGEYPFTITGLTNGTGYTIRITAVSHNIQTSNFAQTTGTPVAPVTTLPATTLPSTTLPSTTLPSTTLSATGSISGNVKDSSNVNIAGAVVTDGITSTTTDTNGNYLIQYIPAGTYNVTASKTGFISSTINNVIVIAGQNTSGKNFVLTPSSGSTHKKCINSICQEVDGTGTDECITIGQACSQPSSSGNSTAILIIGVAALGLYLMTRPKTKTKD